MSAAVAERTYTPEDLLDLDDGGKGYELVGGQLVEKNVGAFASWIAGRVLRLLATYGEDLGLGWALGAETGYRCFEEDPRKVRKPDASFIRRGRLPDERIPDGHVPIAPDLALEVVSPNDTAYEVEARIQEYLGAGVPLVWVVYPESRTIYVYGEGGTTLLLQQDHDLTAPELLPDLRHGVGDLFALPPGP